MIFLATEDKDIYEAMLKEFPGKVVVIAQERHSVSEMKEKDATLIYEFEKKLNTGKAYEDALEDTTVNYFYALTPESFSHEMRSTVPFFCLNSNENLSVPITYFSFTIVVCSNRIVV